METGEQNPIAGRDEFKALALRFGELFSAKIGRHVISAGAPLQATYAGNTRLQTRIIGSKKGKGAHDRATLLVNLSSPAASVLLQGNMHYCMPGGLLEVKGKPADITTLFNAACAGLEAARDAEDATTRQQHYTRPPTEPAVKRSGWSR